MYYFYAVFRPLQNEDVPLVHLCAHIHTQMAAISACQPFDAAQFTPLRVYSFFPSFASMLLSGNSSQ